MNTGLTIRAARQSEIDRIGEIIFADPPPESVWMTGSKARAIAFGLALTKLACETGWRNTVVAETDHGVVGILQVGGEGVKVGPALAFHALRIVGPFGAPGLIRRMNVRQRVNFSPPDGSYHIAELHVDEALRGQGIGGALLDHAEAEARRIGRPMMSLVTATSNPARRLYERHGFEVTETKTDAEYEAGTGSAGRILMLKRL